MTTGLALLGCGTVGSAVAEMLLAEKSHLQERSGQRLELRRILVRDKRKSRNRMVPKRLITTNAEDILADPAVTIVVELMGGIEPARTLLLRSLAAGKHVVTANKHLLALHGAELFAAASKAGRCICFEASCGGAIPIIMALTRGLIANSIDRVIGIVNGTCNYILSQMSASGQSYAEALSGAQAEGFAEPDPTFDVSGIDSAHKLAILAALAFGVQVPFEKITICGINNLDDLDLKFSRELGYTCKLLAIGERTTGGISLRVAPTLIPARSVLANVHGPFNAISVFGHAAGQTTYYGRGAGPKPTASAVIADIVEAAMGTASLLFANLPLLTKRTRGRFLPANKIVARNYLRITALDSPGVMHQITGILGRRGISLSAIAQHESKAGAYVPLVITTHEAVEGDIAKAVVEIDRLKCTKGKAVRLNIIDPAA